MNSIGKRLGFALVFTGFAVALNIYAVLNGSAQTFYEGVTEYLLNDGDHTAEAGLQPDYQMLKDDCTQLAEIRPGAARSTPVSHTSCGNTTAIGI